MTSSERASVARAATILSAAATTDHEPSVEEPRASATDGRKSAESSLVDGSYVNEFWGVPQKRAPAGVLAPIGGGEMQNERTSNESCAATASPSVAATTDRKHAVEVSEATPAESSEVKLFPTVEVPIERLVEADWNPNRLPVKLLAKLRR